jgi:hypothetical protein
VHAAHWLESTMKISRKLEERLGGYATVRLYCTERLINDLPTGEYVRYLLWESPL